MLAALSATTLFAADIAGTLYRTDLTVRNTGVLAENTVVPFDLSSSSLINANFIEDDFLNAVVHEFGLDVQFMPPSGILALEGAVADDGATFSSGCAGCADLTVPVNDTSANDFSLLPADPLVGDALYFVLHNPGRILSLNVGTAGSRVTTNWTVAWEYFTASGYTAVTDLVDGTVGFTLAGTRKVTFAMPTDWIEDTVLGITGFTLRARVTDAGAGAVTQPLGTQAFYETGQLWVFLDSLDTDQQSQFELSLGGLDLLTFHHVLPGAAGIITPDDPSLEFGSSPWEIEIQGFLNTNVSGGTRNIVRKDGALTVNVSATEEISVGIGISGNQAVDATTDDAQLFNSESTYSSARDAAEADLASLGTTTARIGQSFDATVAVQSFGDKVDDP